MLAHRRDKQLPPLPLPSASHAYDCALALEPLSVAPLSIVPSGQGRPALHATELLQQNTRLQRIVALQNSEIKALKQELEQAKLFAQKQSSAITDVLRTTSMAFKRYGEIASQPTQRVPASGSYYFR